VKAAFFDLDRGLLRGRPWWQRLRGCGPSPVEAAASHLYLRRHAAALIAHHRQQRHFTVLLTSGPPALGQQAVRTLGADGVLLAPEGADPRSAHWRCRAVREFCSRYDFASALSAGYGAQAEDWLWLELLAQATVIHPVASLRRMARTVAWPEVDLDRRRWEPPAPPL